MRSRGAVASRKSPAALACVAFVTLSLLGCDSTDPVTSPQGTPTGEQSPSAPGSAPPAEPRAQLAAAAAAASDLRMTAFYTLQTPGRPDRTVAVTLAEDGGWRVDIPGGAPGSASGTGGTGDVAMAQNADGLFRCALPSAANPVTPYCVRLGDPDAAVEPALDPRLHHLFADWRAVLADRRAPLAVSVTEPLDGVDGTCFSVESTTTSLQPPLDVGIYCYRPDGTLTGARVELGTLLLAGQPGAAPPSITLPGPVTTGVPPGSAGTPATSSGSTTGTG
ncbi:hypothetical protein [Solwaraspora sp. WMMD792]|uniref:hypothetical protein n=1 Tax=Solwaraspora sp. WMMD792 TaxID=3016099 RepID=UPI00241780C1|nr:hypothetical protein [Solwaraspora sp. WMMD792]MDG4773502.1 hypothetical protein [Solwaraspora sp. WMMD792]